MVDAFEGKTWRFESFTIEIALEALSIVFRHLPSRSIMLRLRVCLPTNPVSPASTGGDGKVPFLKDTGRSAPTRASQLPL